jgi:hypothetical protein
MPYASFLHPKFMPSVQAAKAIPHAYITIIYIQSAKFFVHFAASEFTVFRLN